MPLMFFACNLRGLDILPVYSESYTDQKICQSDWESGL